MLDVPEGLGIDEAREVLRDRARKDLYFVAKGIIGFSKMTPTLHKRVALHMQDQTKRRKLTVLPRGFYKTSLCTIAHTVQLIIQDPNTRILIVNETQSNARRFLRKIKSVFERNDVFKWLFPELVHSNFSAAKRWSADEMEVPRSEDWPEATVEAMGLGAKTSRHFKWIKFDDLVSNAAADSPTTMDKAKDELAYAEPLLTNPAEDYIDYIGTRWGNDDVIAHGLEENLFDSQLIVSARTAGVPSFPEQYNDERLRELERRLGPYKYNTLYLNDPYDESMTDFKEEWLRWYELDEKASERYGEFILRIQDSREAIKRTNLDITVCVDPAKSKLRTSARTAITAVGSEMTYKQRRFLLEAWADYARPQEIIAKLIAFCKTWRPRAVAFEEVGFQFMLREEFERARDKAHLEVGVIEVKTPTNVQKETRIRGLQPDFFRGDIYVREDQQDFLDEYRKFPTGRLVDILDSLAYHPQIWTRQHMMLVTPDEDRAEEEDLASRPAWGY